MGKIKGKDQAYLEKKFGTRVSFRRVERKLYSHDIAAMPSLIRPFIGNTTPEAVVQPETEEELAELVHWASEKGIALTPRGKASSGYGGVLPVKKGIVVDFFRLNKVLKVDKEAQTATVQAGVVWEKLDRELEKQGLALRLYPSSYPGSTVGGWFAQGGAGFGSYEAGWFGDNIVGARVVLADGTVRAFAGEDLKLIDGAEGITGFISQLTIRVQPLEDLKVVAVACPDAHDLQRFVQGLVDNRIPIWSLSFINPRMAELKNKAPLMEHNGRPAEERVLLPAAYVITLAYRSKDHEVVSGRLPEVLKACQGEILSDRIANHEWEERSKLMVVKRLGPSLVPAELVIPLKALGDVMEEIDRKIDQPVVKEGIVIRESVNGESEVVILGFIPSDQRTFSYNLVFSLVMTVMKIAENHGGRPYSTGLYFKGEAAKVMGKGKVDRLKTFKKQVDPQGLLNPGKVIGHGLISRVMSLAKLVEPMARPIGNRVITHVGERPGKSVRGISADVAWYAYSCSQCGYCVEECDQFYGRGWESQSPRGKWYWLREYMEGREEWDQFMVDTIIACTTCELCNLRCSASLPIEPSWLKLRGHLIDEKKEMTFPPLEMMATALRKEGDIWAGYRRDRTNWFPEDLKKKHGPSHKSNTVYFAGCTASYVEHDIAMATVRLLDAAGVDFTYLGEKENCCATPMLMAGKWDVFEETMRKNIAAVKAAGADTVISSCPACDMMWRQEYPRWAKKLGFDYTITVKHYSEILAEKIRSGEFVFPENRQATTTVTWHDSCHIGRASGVYEEPRDLIKAVPNVQMVEMEHNRAGAHCCGSVMTLIKEPPVAADIGKYRLDEAMEVGAEKVLALCPCCEFQLRVSAEKKDLPIEIVDLARFAASALGYKFPDPNPEVQKQWATFEAMIGLMSPEGFADLMQTMWPEIIDAMPYGMGPMMRVMGKIPGALELMKPLYPILFPTLMPKMMPALKPTLIERVKARVPMADYMEEQMPDILPEVMDNLMPHMIADVVPLVSSSMIDYLRGRNGSQLK
jgi:Fe-S oxidoreductase/FAD/FMN-containing dehydrogenase